MDALRAPPAVPVGARLRVGGRRAVPWRHGPRGLADPARAPASPPLRVRPAARPLVDAAFRPRCPRAPSRCRCCRFSTARKSGSAKPSSAVAARLGRAAESGRQEVDRGSLGERLTRFYEYAGSRFILVFEPFERNGEARVAAIYLP